MNKIQKRKQELRELQKKHLQEIEDNTISLKEELGEYVQGALIAGAAGLAVWALGSSLASLIGGKNPKKGRIGKAVGKMVSPFAAQILFDVLRPGKEDKENTVLNGESTKEKV